MDSHYELYRWDDPQQPNLDWSHLWEDVPYCSDCATTENLTPYTVAGKHKHICRECLADCRAEGEI
jgi:hypothetical protein